MARLVPEKVRKNIMHNPRFVPLTVHVPQIFVRLAHFYKISPQRLANAILFSFCCAPPRDLILVQRAQVQKESAVLSDQS
jgi:hypothetical protein